MLGLRANHLTVLRVVLLPLPYFLLYQGTWGKVTALVIFIALGLTDYLDGMLARMHGPTPLGKLLDPIADKIFLVVITVCLVDFSILPMLFAIPILARESLVAEIRQAGISLDVTELAKIKTTIQMAASGLMFLLDTSQSKLVLIAFLAGAVIATVFLAVAIFVKENRLSQRMSWAMGLLGLGLILAILFPPDGIYLAYGMAIVVITLVSGGKYLMKGLPSLWKRGPLGVVRAFLVASFPICPLLAVERVPHDLLWLIIMVLALEYISQGVDAVVRGYGGKDLSGIKTWVVLPFTAIMFLWAGGPVGSHTGDPWPFLALGLFSYLGYVIFDIILNKGVVFKYS